MNRRLLWAEAEPPDLVLVQLLDAQGQVGRAEPAAGETTLNLSPSHFSARVRLFMIIQD